MRLETVIITPELSGGGVGDYTCRLLENLPVIPDLRLIVPKGGKHPTDVPRQGRIEETESKSAALQARLPAHGTVLVQYSAYGFDHFGYPRWLIKALLAWKKESQGILAIMFHEIWAFWPVWNRNYFLQRLHRRDLGRLLGVADAIFTSTPSQAEHLGALSPRSGIEVLPVGSNISRTDAVVREREVGCAVLFGLQRARLRSLRKMGTDLKRLTAAKKIRKVLTAGAGSSPEGDREERTLLQGLDLIDGFQQRGALPEQEISELLSSCAFAISAQDELSIPKSGTFMACAAHRLNILSPFADASKPEPLCLLTSPDEMMKGVTEAKLQSRGEQLRQWQERTSAWPHIADRIARGLKIGGSNQASPSTVAL